MIVGGPFSSGGVVGVASVVAMTGLDKGLDFEGLASGDFGPSIGVTGISAVPASTGVLEEGSIGEEALGF